MKHRILLASLVGSLLAFAWLDDGRAAPQAKGPRTYKGRVIAPVMSAGGGGAEWLDRDDRDLTEQPDRVIDALKIAPGTIVADVGAGTGYFSIRIARRIAPDGKVLATDLQPEMLRQLGDNMKKAGVKNVERIRATDTDSKLPAGQVDLALMVDVYHELQDPERTMAQIRRALKDNARLVLVEYRAEDPDVPIRPEHKTTLRQIRYEIEPMGFRLREVFEFLPHQHVEVFDKDDLIGEDPIVDPSDFPTVRRLGWSGVADAAPYVKGMFQPVFNGHDLNGWVSDAKNWFVRNATLVGRAGSGRLGSELKTAEEYSQFELDLQWRFTEVADSSAISLGTNPRLTIRIDGGVPFAPGYPETIANRRTGEITSEKGAEPICRAVDTAKALVFPGDWNRLTVRQAGDRTTLGINGVQVAEVQAATSAEPAPIVLHSPQSEIAFREIWIKRLGD